jgi:hypothetical protein
MKRHTKRPDGFQCSDYSFFMKRKMKWVCSLKVGDKISTCRGTVEEIESIDVENDDLKTTEGNHCSPYHCCESPTLSFDSVTRKWAKKHPDKYKEFLRNMNKIRYAEESK